jgi:hypothetical protein
MVRRPSVPFVLAASLCIALAGCTTETTSPSPDATAGTSSSSGSTPTDRPTVDPLVPYSPAPTPLDATTNGFVTETLTLPSGDGGTMLVTVDGTAIDTRYVEGHRSMSVWVTLENPTERSWTGVPAAFASITDEAENVFEPVDPTAADLHPKPERYGASNLDLHGSRTIEPGESLQGVIVFRPTGGNRAITISISLNGGGVWGTWITTMGPF